METYAKLLADLQKAQVKYMLVGGLAVYCSGFERHTRDVDILVSVQGDNLKEMLSVLVNFGEGYAAELVPDDFPLEEGAVRLVEDFPVDIFTQMRGNTYEDFESKIDLHELSDGVKIPFLSAEGLIELKQHSTREKDRYDVFIMQKILKSEDPDM